MYSSSIQTETATIANGATESSAVNCGLARVARLSMPAAFTGVSLGVLRGFVSSSVRNGTAGLAQQSTMPQLR